MGTKMGLKSSWRHLWGPLALPGGPLSAQGCHLVPFGGHFGVSLGAFSAQKWHPNHPQKGCDFGCLILSHFDSFGGPYLVVVWTILRVRRRLATKRANMFFCQRLWVFEGFPGSTGDRKPLILSKNDVVGHAVFRTSFWVTFLSLLGHIFGHFGVPKCPNM